MCGVLMQISLIFCQQRSLFEDDGTKIAGFVQLLCNRTLQWAQVVLRADPKITYPAFLLKFKSVFDKGSSAKAAAHRLLNLKQGQQTMANYSTDFQVQAKESGWGENVLQGTLLNNLCDEFKDDLTMRELPTSLGALLTLGKSQFLGRILRRLPKADYITARQRQLAQFEGCTKCS